MADRDGSDGKEMGKEIENDKLRIEAVAGCDKRQQTLLGRGQHYPAEWTGRFVLCRWCNWMLHEDYARKETDHRKLQRSLSHIGEACFQAEAEKNCGNYYKAFEKACELGGTKFLTDLFSGSQISQEPIRIQPEEKAEQEKIMEKIEVDKALLNVKEVCAYLGIGETKARELLTKTNNHFTVRIGKRVFANKIQLDKWIAQNSGNKVEKRRTIQRRVKKEEPDMGMQIMM